MQLEFGNYVHFIEILSEGLVTVGCSGNPFQRASHMQSRLGTPVLLLGAVPGDSLVKCRIVNSLKDVGAHVRDSWFKYDACAAEIGRLLDEQPYRFPRKLTKVEIVLWAQRRYPASQEEYDAAGALLEMLRLEPRLLDLD